MKEILSHFIFPYPTHPSTIPLITVVYNYELPTPAHPWYNAVYALAK